MSTQSENEREIVKLWRAWRTAHQMCHDRGYQITPHELTLPLSEFRTLYTHPQTLAPNRLHMNFSAQPTPAALAKHTPLPTASNPNPTPQIGTIWVEFNASSKGMGIQDFRKFIHSVVERNFQTGILIVPVSVTAAALKLIPTVAPRMIEVFAEQDLLVNVTQHELVPKHVLLSFEEKKALLERYRVKESQLPRIQVGDPVARYLGLRRGQVVKIVRRSETAGRYASYRWAI